MITSLFNELFGIFKNKILCLIDELDPALKKRKVTNSFCMEQILRVLKKGIGWRDATIEGVNYTTVYKRFIQWVRKGVFKQIWNCLLDLYVQKKLKVFS